MVEDETGAHRQIIQERRRGSHSMTLSWYGRDTVFAFFVWDMSIFAKGLRTFVAYYKNIQISQGINNSEAIVGFNQQSGDKEFVYVTTFP